RLGGWRRCCLAVALVFFSSLAAAQGAYPARPIKLVVPYPPGALTDLLVRAEYVAKQPPDGYTLLMATSTTLGISPALYRPSPIDPVRDFAPIAQIGSVDFFLVANPSFPAKTVREMIDAVKRAPGKYNYASVGSGSPHHLFMETMKSELGLEIQHVPYKGTPAAMTDLLTGQVQVMFADATLAAPNILAGKLTGLGTSSATQTTLLA